MLYAFVAFAGLFAAGCNWILPIIFLMDEPTQKVKPEYGRLMGRRVAVVVWAKPSTLAVFPYARYDTCNAVTVKLRDTVAGVQTISASLIEEHIEMLPTSTVDPEEVGKAFDAEAVVFLELLEYQTRDPDSPQMLQGRITSSVVVYDLEEKNTAKNRYELSTVSVAVPEKPTGALSGDELQIRKETLSAFAEAVTQKFIEHEKALE